MDDDAKYMGTRAEAEAELLARWETFCRYSQPIMGTAKQVREHEAGQRESQLRLALAGAALAWHLNRERGPASPLARATADLERDHPLPRCEHGKALRDHGGERLEPPCGCRA